MNQPAYVETVRHRCDNLVEDRRVLVERGVQFRSNWGLTTEGWLAEMDRRIAEQSAILNALERGLPI